ncbi:MAG: complex I NDUFA9 subunit family protein [Alphaproteobacteria bacterium]|nr:complex I NDUFA9 subunit family protein [Alphaproteobacteria bacterium]
MTIDNKTATVFGGTGFLGRQVVRELAKRGITVKVATRAPERAYFLRTCGVVGQIVPFACDYSAESIESAVKGSDYVVNCVGILYERRKGDFKRAHIDFPAAIAAASAKEKVKRLVHISALGIDKARSRYAKTKQEGERAVLTAFPRATILRPSVIFGAEDNFFNMFARMAMIMPALPLIGGGHTKFQPVYVGDVADAVMAALERPALGEENPQGKAYELGGPEEVTFRDIYERLFHFTQRPRPLVPLPFGVAKMNAAVLGLLPGPLLTPDQVESLKTDSVVSMGAPGFQDLGITPTAMDIILPTYLGTWRPGGRFADKKAA